MWRIVRGICGRHERRGASRSDLSSDYRVVRAKLSQVESIHRALKERDRRSQPCGELPRRGVHKWDIPVTRGGHGGGGRVRRSHQVTDLGRKILISRPIRRGIQPPARPTVSHTPCTRYCTSWGVWVRPDRQERLASGPSNQGPYRPIVCF